MILSHITLMSIFNPYFLCKLNLYVVKLDIIILKLINKGL